MYKNVWTIKNNWNEVTYLGTPRRGSGVTEELRTTPEVFAGAGDTMLLEPWRYPPPAGLCLFHLEINLNLNYINKIPWREPTRYLMVGLGCGATNDARCWYWEREAAAGGEGSGGKPFSNVVGWLLELEWGIYVLFTRGSRFDLGTGAGAPGGTSECETLGWDGFTVGCILFTENN